MGAKAGIGVGVALGVLGFLLGALALLITLQKKKKRKAEKHPEALSMGVHEAGGDEVLKAEMQQPDPPHYYAYQLPGAYGGIEIDGTSANKTP